MQSHVSTCLHSYGVLVKLASQVRDISLKQTQMDELTNIYGIKNHDYKISLQFNSFLSKCQRAKCYESKTNIRAPKNKYKTKYELENTHKPGMTTTYASVIQIISSFQCQVLIFPFEQKIFFSVIRQQHKHINRYSVFWNRSSSHLNTTKRIIISFFGDI